MSVFTMLPGGLCGQATAPAKATADSKPKNYQPARFEGGDAALRAYIINHLTIKPDPQNDHQADLQFDVTDEGALTNFRVDGNISMRLTFDLKNVLKAMHYHLHPQPATQNGQPVKSTYQLSIKFG